MPHIALQIQRAIWFVVFLSAMWGLATGEAVTPLHPYNIIQFGALIVGTVAAWVPHRKARLASGLCGIVFSLMTAYQVATLLRLFAGFPAARFTMQAGPLVLEGAAAHCLAWGAPLLLLTVSGMIVVGEWLPRDSAVRID